MISIPRHAVAMALLLSMSVAAPALAKKDKSWNGATMAQAQPVEGRVQRLLSNPYGEVDALLLDSGTLVRFPAHMSSALLAVARPGDRLAIVGRPERNGTDVRAYTIRNLATGRAVTEAPRLDRKPPKHLRYAGLAPMLVSGTIDRHLTGKRGELKGVILRDGTVVRFPARAADPYSAGMAVGATIKVSGRGTRTATGRALEAEAVAVGSGALQPLWRR